MFGARLPIDTAINLIFDRLQQIVVQVPNATLSDALGTSMMVACADGAKMESLPKERKNVTTLSLVPCSRFLVEKCGVCTSSTHHILPINQLNAKDHRDHIKHILRGRFVDWIAVKESEPESKFDIKFQDMNDAKFTYMMIQCSAWSRKYHPFSGCECRRGEGFISGKCMLISDDKYRE